MQKLLIPIFIMVCISAYGQAEKTDFSHPLLGFFRMKPIPPFKWIRTSPRFMQVSTNEIQNAYSYWLGAMYTSYSENGRFRTTHMFDVQGQLRESRASYSLKKNGALSYWRVQISPQRTRPLFIYTIH